MANECQSTVRVHCLESDVDCLYFAMDRCLITVEQLVDLSPDDNCIVELAGRKIAVVDLQLWQSRDTPSPHLINLMRNIVSGIQYLHICGHYSCQFETSNVLIDKNFSGKISDMGVTRIAPHSVFCHSGWSQQYRYLKRYC